MGHAALCSCAGGSAGLEVCHAILVTKWHLSRWPEPSDRRTPAWCHAVCMLCPPASLPTAQHYTEERHILFHPSFISVLNGLKYLSEARVRSRDSKGAERRDEQAGLCVGRGDKWEWRWRWMEPRSRPREEATSHLLSQPSPLPSPHFFVSTNLFKLFCQKRCTIKLKEGYLIDIEYNQHTSLSVYV